MKYVICENCGAHLDFNEKCDCIESAEKRLEKCTITKQGYKALIISPLKKEPGQTLKRAR